MAKSWCEGSSWGRGKEFLSTSDPSEFKLPSSAPTTRPSSALPGRGAVFQLVLLRVRRGERRAWGKEGGEAYGACNDPRLRTSPTAHMKASPHQSSLLFPLESTFHKTDVFAKTGAVFTVGGPNRNIRRSYKNAW
eukprot:1074296-Rhodomonas_salina.2